MCGFVTIESIPQIFYYSESIFEGAGVAAHHVSYAIIGTGAINLVTTMNSVRITSQQTYNFV